MFGVSNPSLAPPQFCRPQKAWSSLRFFHLMTCIIACMLCLSGAGMQEHRLMDDKARTVRGRARRRWNFFFTSKESRKSGHVTLTLSLFPSVSLSATLESFSSLQASPVAPDHGKMMSLIDDDVTTYPR